MWAPTVITGVISPINGLITGFHWFYFTPKSSGVAFQLVESVEKNINGGLGFFFNGFCHGKITCFHRLGADFFLFFATIKS